MQLVVVAFLLCMPTAVQGSKRIGACLFILNVSLLQRRPRRNSATGWRKLRFGVLSWLHAFVIAIFGQFLLVLVMCLPVLVCYAGVMHMGRQPPCSPAYATHATDSRRGNDRDGVQAAAL